MSGFKLDDYVDVAQRIQDFKAVYPEGRLCGHGEFVRDASGEIVGYIYTAHAHTTPTDTCPAIGTAYEPIPGKTTFTKDSEVMNAETSAWGRAIVALGFPTKKIASAEEVRNRQSKQQDAPPADPSPVPAGGAKPNGEVAVYQELTAKLLATCDALGVDLDATRALIAKNVAKTGLDLPAHEEWLRRQLATAEANLEQKESPFVAPVPK